jgi:hypothetical protein
MSTLEKLAAMSHSRTVRTDRLAASVQSILAQLSKVTEDRFTVDVRGATLRHTWEKTNVGHVERWLYYPESTSSRVMYDEDAFSVDLDQPVGGEGFYNGDFGCPWNGPSRADLVSFAQRAFEFVEELVKRERVAETELSAAEADVKKAEAAL